MEDLRMREKVLTIVTEKGEQSLSQLVCHIEASETTTWSQGWIRGGQLARLETDKKSVRKGKPQEKAGRLWV